MTLKYKAGSVSQVEGKILSNISFDKPVSLDITILATESSSCSPFVILASCGNVFVVVVVCLLVFSVKEHQCISTAKPPHARLGSLQLPRPPGFSSFQELSDPGSSLNIGYALT